MVDFLGKIYLRSKSACKIGKYLLIKLLIFGKIGLYDVTNSTEFGWTLLTKDLLLKTNVYDIGFY